MKNWIWLKSLAGKEIKRVFRIWKQTILPPIITSILYFLIFGTFIWSKIESIKWVSYIEFIIPWFIMMSVIMSSYANVSSSFFGAKFQRSIEEILVSPLPNWMIIFSYCLAWVTRGIIVWIIIYLIALFFTDIVIINYFITILFLFLTSLLFSLIWLFNSFFAKNFDDVNIIPTFVLMPLVYLWWVFYSLDFISPFWQTVSQFNPIFYMVNWLRYGMLNISEVSIYFSLLAIIGVNILMFLVNMKLMKVWYGLKN